MRAIIYTAVFIAGLCLRTWFCGSIMNGSDIIVAFAAVGLVYGVSSAIQPRKKKKRRR